MPDVVRSIGLDPSGLVETTLTGVVTASDQLECVRFVRAAIATLGGVRVLIRLKEYAGWHYDARLDDHALWLRDDEGVRRMAIVGAPEWRVSVLTTIAQPLRQIPIVYFNTEAAARRWLNRAI